eukprot:4493248-Lingulodinium_polyedra.AAC.1
MKAADGNGGVGFVRKETKWMTSSPVLAQALSHHCANLRGGPEHRHVHLIGGRRASLAAEYPPKLVATVLRGLKEQLRVDGRELHSFEAGP